MTIKTKRRTRSIAICLLAFMAGVASILWTMPGAIACVLIDQAPLSRWADKRISESTDHLKHDHYDLLLAQSRKRIDDTFGSSNANPHVVFFDSAESIPFLDPNLYGSTQFIGTRACVFIGPKGQNVDVVSHELMHAEIFSIVGPVNRTLRLPMWFEEGLAMQVDYRPQYDISRVNDIDASIVDSWTTSRTFFDATGSELTNRYELAKSRVGKWVKSVGSAAVYSGLMVIASDGIPEELGGG